MLILPRLLSYVGVGTGASYLAFCVVMFVGQRYFIYSPSSILSTSPKHPLYNMPYEEFNVQIKNSSDYLHCWYIPAANKDSTQHIILREEPVNILMQAKTILYFTGAGYNKAAYLARMKGFRQLGFSIFTFDYRGYGKSKGAYPKEKQFYADAQLAWQYLTEKKQIAPEDIIIYGESLGGAIGIDLAMKQPKVGGLIVQSSFTSMADTIRQMGLMRYVPVKLMLTERFNSIKKLKKIRVPILFLHGTADELISFYMSEKLFHAANEPKQLFLIPGGSHGRIYQPTHSYLKAIRDFMNSLPKR
jgi:alpha-beta hydrolase superfamily lysophospholipase